MNPETAALTPNEHPVDDEGLGAVIDQTLARVTDADQRALLERATGEFVSLVHQHVTTLGRREAHRLLRERDPQLVVDILVKALSNTFVAPNARERSRMKARARFRTLLEANGGTLSAEQVADILDITVDAVRKRAQAGTLIALKSGEQWQYPAFQFTDSGLVEGVREVLTILGDVGGLPQCRFLLTVDPDLDGRRRIDALQDPALKPYVLRSAEQLGEQGPL